MVRIVNNSRCLFSCVFISILLKSILQLIGLVSFGRGISRNVCFSNPGKVKNITSRGAGTGSNSHLLGVACRFMPRVGMILITAMLVMMLFAPAASAEITHLYYDSDSGTPISASITTNVNIGSTYSSNQRYYTLLSTSDNEDSTRTRWRNFNTGSMNPVLTLVNPTAYSQDTLITGISGTFRVRGSSNVPAFYVRIIDFSDSGEVVLGTAGPLYGTSTSSDSILNFDLSSISGTIPAGNKLGMQVIVDNGGESWRFYGNAGSTGTTMDFYVDETLAITSTYNVTVTPSSTSAGVIAGGSYNYTITVNNNGNTDGNYNLGVFDSNAVDFSTSTLGTTSLAVASGGSAQTTLTVTANGGAPGSASDITTVTATCVEDGAYTGSAQVITTVQDTTAPVITSVTLNTTTPNIGDYVLVMVNTTDDTAVTAVVANGVSLSKTLGNIWEGIIVAIMGTQSVNVSSSDAVSNTAWNNATSYTATTPDTTAPVITLLGNASETVEVGSVYTDAGATVSDNYDTGLIATMTGSVDNTTVGIYTLTYNVNDSSNNAAISVTRTVNVVDTQAPVITLLGNAFETVEVGSVYTDAGSTVSDNYDTGLTATITGSVNTATVGIYTLTYNVNDSSNNAAISVTRTVNVVDTQVPVITLLGNAFETVEVGSVYIDAGATVSDNYDTGLIATMTGSVDNTTVGSYTLTYNVNDSSNNAAISVTRTVNVVDVVDTEIPVIILLGNAFETVEVGSVYTDAGATVSDNYDTGLIATMTGSVDNTTVGIYTLTYNVNDSSNNAAISVTRTVNVVDTQAPVITLLGNKTILILVGSTYTDAGATVTDNYDTGLTATMKGSVDNASIGNNLLTYNVNDSSNNAATPVTRMVVVVGAGDVKGFVRDSATGFGIAGAIVSTNTSITKTTDANGFYSMVLDAGTYNLTVIRDPVYYSNSSVTIDISIPHLDQDIVLTLKPTGSITGIVTY